MTFIIEMYFLIRCMPMSTRTARTV